MMQAEVFESRSRAGEDDLTDAVMEASQIFIDEEEQSCCSFDQLSLYNAPQPLAPHQ